MHSCLFMSFFFLGDTGKAMPQSADWWNTRISMQYQMKTNIPPWKKKKKKNQRECHSKGLIIAPERWRKMCSPLRQSSDLQRGVIHLLFWVCSNPRLQKRNLGNCFISKTSSCGGLEMCKPWRTRNLAVFPQCIKRMFFIHSFCQHQSIFLPCCLVKGLFSASCFCSAALTGAG